MSSIRRSAFRELAHTSHDNAISDLLAVPDGACVHLWAIARARGGDLVGNRVLVKDSAEERRVLKFDFFAFGARSGAIGVVRNVVGMLFAPDPFFNQMSVGARGQLAFRTVRRSVVGDTPIDLGSGPCPHLGAALDLAKSNPEALDQYGLAEMMQFVREAILQTSDERLGAKAVAVLHFPPVDVPLRRQADRILLNDGHSTIHIVGGPTEGPISLDRLPPPVVYGLDGTQITSGRTGPMDMKTGESCICGYDVASHDDDGRCPEGGRLFGAEPHE